MNNRFEGRHILVTGAGSGIGRAIALRFAVEGAMVGVLDRDESAALEVAGVIGGAGGAGYAETVDVADFDGMGELVDRLRSGRGRIHGLVNNAGIAHIGDVEATTPDDFNRVFQVNVAGVYHGLHAVVPRMVEDGGGVVLNMCSIAARIGIQERFAYSMSKGAVLSMTLSVARDYVGRGVRCNCICPARIHTPFIDGYLADNYPGREHEMLEELCKYQPIGRMGTPEEVAALAAWLCSDEAGFVTGAAYDLDGGVMALR